MAKDPAPEPWGSRGNFADLGVKGAAVGDVPGSEGGNESGANSSTSPGGDGGSEGSSDEGSEDGLDGTRRRKGWRRAAPTDGVRRRLNELYRHCARPVEIGEVCEKDIEPMSPDQPLKKYSSKMSDRAPSTGAS